jgi:hypothetical protein
MILVVDVVADVAVVVAVVVAVLVAVDVAVTVEVAVEVTVVTELGAETVSATYPPIPSIAIMTTTAITRVVREIALLVEKPTCISFREKSCPCVILSFTNRIVRAQSISVPNLFGRSKNLTWNEPSVPPAWLTSAKASVTARAEHPPRAFPFGFALP